MSKLNKILILFSLSLIILLAHGCKSKTTLVEMDGKTTKKSAKQLLEDALASQLDYRTINTKGSISLNGRKSSAVYKFIKDSVIQASVRPILGMEAFRLDIMPDSIIIVDRLKKEYFAESLSKLTQAQQIDFNFQNLQALFTNQLFAPGSQIVSRDTYKDFKLNINSDLYILSTVDNNKLNYNFAINPSGRIVSTLISKLNETSSIQWSYDDFVADGAHVYPISMNAKIKFNKKQINIGIDYNKLNIDEELNVNSSIPKNYKRIELGTLIEAFVK